MIIGLFAVFFLTACEEPPIYKADYSCRVLTNESGHDLKITLIREDTTVQYHIANNESVISESGEDFLITENPPGYTPPPPSLLELDSRYCSGAHGNSNL